MSLHSCPLFVDRDGEMPFCMHERFLSIVLPPAACIASALLFTLSFLYRRNEKIRLAGRERRLRASSQMVAGQGAGDMVQQPITSYTTKHGTVITIIEGITILLHLSILIIALIYERVYQHREFIPYSTPRAVAGILLSSYSLMLFLAKVWVGDKRPEIQNRLWLHLAFLYTAHWLLLLLTSYMAVFNNFPSQIIGVRAILFTILVAFSITAPKVPTANEEDYLLHGKSLEDTASVLSRATFSWMSPLVWTAYRSTLEARHLHHFHSSGKSGGSISIYNSPLAAPFSPVWRLLSGFKYDLATQAFWAGAYSITIFIPVILLQRILMYLESSDETAQDASWLCVFGLVLSQIVAAVAECQFDWKGERTRADLRAILVNDIYTKVLRRKIVRPSTIDPEKNEADGNSELVSDGNITNLITADTEAVCFVTHCLPLLFVNGPIQLAISVWLLYRIIGISGIIGVGIMMALIPLNLLLTRQMATVQGRVLKAGDERIEVNTEVVANIRTIKYSGWESFFGARVMALRRRELTQLRSWCIWWSVNMTIFHSLPFIVTALTLLFFTIIYDNELKSSVAFPALAIFVIVRIPLDRMADSISYLLQAHVSLLRIQRFLGAEETDKYTQLSTNYGPGAGFDNATLQWPIAMAGNDDASIPSPSFRLQNLQISFKENGLNVIFGASGSGKTSLLLSLLGEMEVQSGNVRLPRSVAFCPQEPWIMNHTIRENILFGLRFDSVRYSSVLEAVALHPDLDALDKGDHSLAGENGSRLSGGQKQRIALARALYSDAKYVLLDDCFSALDAETGKNVFYRAIKGPLMSGRTCILATHHTHLVLPSSQYATVMAKGYVKGQGSVSELISAGLLDLSFDQKPSDLATTLEDGHIPRLHSQSIGEDSDRSSFNITPSSTPELRDAEHEESKSEGPVPWTILRSYLRAMGPPWYWIVVLCGFVVQQIVSLGTNLWIKEWAHQYDELEEPDRVNAAHYLFVYVVICILYAVITFLRDAFTYYGTLQASAQIYTRLLNSILHAKLSFFDQVPLGQITNRFSKDVRSIDQRMASFAISAVQLLVSIIGTLVLISVELPPFLVMVVIIFAAYYYVGTLYVSSTRDLKRIESVERSPLLQQFGETIAGHVSIRAYRREQAFASQNRKLAIRYNTPTILNGATRPWLNFRVNALSGMISFSVGLLVIWKRNSLTSGAAGLVLTYAINFTENCMWLVQVYGIVQQEANSIERTMEYIDIDHEAVEPLKDDSPIPDEWPSRGSVLFQNYSTRYGPELQPVLKNVTFEASSGTRIAIVGRTGAGKSTLALALIRGLEADSGNICIDGVDISSVNLERLRQRVTVIPQDPTTFSGSLRDNIDPRQEYHDDEIYAALEDSCLLSHLVDRNTGTMTHSLEFPATELSLGQRQLLCIARAFLWRSRVLVLDEASASVDHETDALIQESIRKNTASGTTVVTIAHRLRTIADYDKVVVLEHGSIIEQGSVEELVAKRGPDSKFRQLCEESGDMEMIMEIMKREAASSGRGTQQ